MNETKRKQADSKESAFIRCVAFIVFYDQGFIKWSGDFISLFDSFTYLQIIIIN